MLPYLRGTVQGIALDEIRKLRRQLADMTAKRDAVFNESTHRIRELTEELIAARKELAGYHEGDANDRIGDGGRR